MPRLRKGENVVPDAVVAPIPCNQKTLLTAFDMIRQRAVSKTEAHHCLIAPASLVAYASSFLVFINNVNHATRVQRPHPKRQRLHCDDRVLLNLDALRRDSYPTEIKL